MVKKNTLLCVSEPHATTVPEIRGSRVMIVVSNPRGLLRICIVCIVVLEGTHAWELTRLSEHGEFAQRFSQSVAYRLLAKRTWIRLFP